MHASDIHLSTHPFFGIRMLLLPASVGFLRSHYDTYQLYIRKLGHGRDFVHIHCASVSAWDTLSFLMNATTIHIVGERDRTCDLRCRREWR